MKHRLKTVFISALLASSVNADELPIGLMHTCDGQYFIDQLPSHDTSTNKYDVDLEYAASFYDAFAERMKNEIHIDTNVFEYFQAIEQAFFEALNDKNLSSNNSFLRPRIWVESRDFDSGYTYFPALIPLSGRPLTNQLDIHFGELSLSRKSGTKAPMDIWLEFSSNTSPLITYRFNYVEGFGDSENTINFSTLLKDVNIQTQPGRPIVRIEEHEGGVDTSLRCRLLGYQSR